MLQQNTAMQTRQRALVSAFVMALIGSWSAAATSELVQVTIRDYQFTPATTEIKVGQSVKWTNHEKRASHSVLFTGPAGVESERLFPGESWQRVFDKAGTYAYTCGPHPEMTGKVIVTE